MSSCKSLHNEVEFIESIRHSKKVENTNYYCLKISNFSLTEEESSNLVKWLLTRKTNQPLAVYHTSNKQDDDTITDFYVLFTSVDENEEHFLGGSYNRLISYYSCRLCEWLAQKNSTSFNFDLSIIEFESHIEIFTFFSVKVFDTKHNLFTSLGVKNVNGKTEKEIELLIAGINIDDQNITDHQRYGTFSRLKRKGGKVVLDKMSEYLDARESKKYMNFLLQD